MAKNRQCKKDSKIPISNAPKKEIHKEIIHHETLYGSFTLGSLDDKYSSIIYSVEVDEDKLVLLEEMAKAKLTPHPDICVGFDVYKSVKEVSYE